MWETTAPSDAEIIEAVAIRGTNCGIVHHLWSTELVWYCNDTPLTVKREVLAVRREMKPLRSLADIIEIAKSARVEVLLKFPYVSPRVATLIEWHGKSETLRGFVSQQGVNHTIVLEAMFSSPSAPFIELLLVKLGEL